MMLKMGCSVKSVSPFGKVEALFEAQFVEAEVTLVKDEV